MHSFRFAEFEGPLDLLLQLIERQELDITRVSLAAVTDQFLDIISAPGVVELSQLADYLVIAAKLILIKSRLLLPKPETTEPEEEEDPGEALARQLREYKMFKQVAVFLREREQKGLHGFARLAPPPKPQPREWKLEGAHPDDLARALHRALKIRPAMPQGTLQVPLAVSIDQRIHSILDMTRQRIRVHFTRLLNQAATRVEVIVTFLAVLEMIKRRQIVARQDALFGEIFLEHREETELPVEEIEADYTTE